MRGLGPDEESLLRLIQAENDAPMVESTLIGDGAGFELVVALEARGLVSIVLEEHVIDEVPHDCDVARITDLGRLALRVASSVPSLTEDLRCST
jgi:hypothetical protein